MAQNGIDIGFDFIAGILLGDYFAFPCAAAVALFQIHRPPRNVEVVHGNDPLLGIDSRSEFLRRAEEDPDFPFVHGVEHRLPHLVARGFLYEADLLRRNTVLLDQFAFDLRIDVPDAGLIGREIAENHLRTFLTIIPAVVFGDVGGTAAGLVAGESASQDLSAAMSSESLLEYIVTNSIRALTSPSLRCSGSPVLAKSTSLSKNAC